MSRVLDQWSEARKYLASGVSSSTRVNKAVNHPMLFDRAEGCRVWDLDGREFIDLCCSHGATLLGHGDSRVKEVVERAMSRGAACSYENELHTELARLLCETVPCLDRVRLTGAGTEATMHCIRLARAYTGRPKLLKFQGNFHGYHDQVMFTSWTGTDDPRVAIDGFTAGSAGVTPGVESQLIEVPYNDAGRLADAIGRYGDEIAAVICEPIYYNAGCILPTTEFMSTLRNLTEQRGIVLIFDEVLCALRMAAGGAQQYLDVTPDLCTLGKAIGGSYPLSVFGGRADIMDRLMPTGDCQHSGTYNGHPVIVSAGIAALRAANEPGFYPHIHAIARRLYTGLNDIFARSPVVARVQGLGARFGIYFGIDDEVSNYAQAQQHDREMMLRFIAASIDEGVYFHDYGGVACHHGFCAAMTESDVDEALARLGRAVRKISMP